MNIALQVLDGASKGRVLSLRQGLVFSAHDFNDPGMLKKHAEVFLDPNFQWSIKGLDSGLIRVGRAEKDQINILPGLIFHLGQTGFKVIESPGLAFKNWQEAMIDFLESDTWDVKNNKDFSFFLNPIRLNFIQGPQTDEFLTLSYGPREMGYNNLDLNIKDPSQPQKLLRFYQVGEITYVESIKNSFVLMNGKSFFQHAIESGDKLSFGSNLIELSILK